VSLKAIYAALNGLQHMIIAFPVKTHAFGEADLEVKTVRKLERSQLFLNHTAVSSSRVVTSSNQTQYLSVVE